MSIEHTPNGYRFDVDGGKVYHEGKVYWRDVLYVRMDKRQAIQAIAQLANQLDSRSDEINLTWCGWIKQDEIGKWPFANYGINVA